MDKNADFMMRFQSLSFSLALAAMVSVALFSVGLALVYANPWLVEVRPVALATGLSAAALVILSSAMRLQREKGLAARASSGLTITIAYLALAIFGLQEAGRWWTWSQVMRVPPARLATVGRHVMAGYSDRAALIRLIEAGAVGGVYISARNARVLSREVLALEIQAFQEAARRHGRKPLVIAAEQDGGRLAQLSPPLVRQPSLREVAGAAGGDLGAIRQHAINSGGELRRLGVTLNLAPEVDLDRGGPDAVDGAARRGDDQPAFADPSRVAALARSYCGGLADQGVMCTLRQFPGHGRARAAGDGRAARVRVSRAELSAADWRPYRDVAASRDVAILVGHIVVDAIDPGRTASTSPRVIEVLRGELEFDGVILADDVTVGSIAQAQGGPAGAAVAAIAAGADMVLVGRDSDQIYPVLEGLLKARATAQLEPLRLEASERRLATFVRPSRRLLPWFRPPDGFSLRREP